MAVDDAWRNLASARFVVPDTDNTFHKMEVGDIVSQAAAAGLDVHTNRIVKAGFAMTEINILNPNLED